MTIRDIITSFTAAGIPTPETDARILASAFLHLSNAKILTCEIDNTPLESFPDYPALLTAVNTRKSRYPLQYILGEWDFCGLTFKVNEHCLIPRPDTEIIVEHALAYLKSTKTPAPTLLDICTGSGNIPAAIAYYHPTITADCVELDPDTASLARENVQNLNLSNRVQVHTADLRDFTLPPDKKYNIITSNPPYVTPEEMLTLEPELSYEPRLALTDDRNGLTLIEEIIHKYKSHLAHDGIMLIEHGASQAQSVAEIVQKNNMTCQTLQDYTHTPRAALIRQP